MTTAEQIINNCKKGLITIIQDDTENYVAFSNHKDYNGNYRISGWSETIEKAKRCIGENEGYLEKEMEKYSQEGKWEIVEVYREEVEPFKVGDKVRILPSIENTKDWTNNSIYGSDSRRYFIDMIGEIVDVYNSESGLHYNVANNGEPRLYKTFIGHEYLAPSYEEDDKNKEISVEFTLDEIAMEEQPRTMPYEESVYFLKNGLAILLKGARKDLTVTDLATIIASVLDVSEYEEFAGLLLRLSKHEEKE